MPVAMDERIAERRREVAVERQTGRRRRTVTIAVLLILAAVTIAIERSPLVALDRVEVTGTVRLRAATVREAADLTLGTSILRLRLADAEERVEALPLVLTAEAHRSDPLTVVIDVVERQPLLVAVSPSAQVLVDQDGVVLATGREPGVPVVEVPAVPRPGQGVEAAPALRTAHTVYVRVPTWLRSQVTGLAAARPRALEMTLRDGTRVRFGDARRIREKVRALRAVLDDLGDTPVAVIDVRAPGTPTARR